MDDFVLKILSELETFARTASWTLCEPDSETLNSDTDSQLARGIQTKIVLSLGAETPDVGEGAMPPTNQGLKGSGTPYQIFFCSNLHDIF